MKLFDCICYYLIIRELMQLNFLTTNPFSLTTHRDKYTQELFVDEYLFYKFSMLSLGCHFRKLPFFVSKPTEFGKTILKFLCFF